ncbi:GGDEF domain-containing protein [Vallitalea guaymasensis]|uniref:GGDEF domain-containing protein n=1 Tax=Vallitalea guaymasensis TaxID=1185412 RepID=UPI000DE2A8EB|nr:GGDEF domain-containing protein [Vallitalea guaymasensis]
MDNRLIISIAINVIIIIVCYVIIKIKTKTSQKIKSEKNLLSDIIKISFENASLSKAIDEIIYRITKLYKVKYVTIFKFNESKKYMDVISSNVPDKYVNNICDYTNIINKEKLKDSDAYIEKPKNKSKYLVYPTAEDRFIKYLYYIPLQINNELIGSILIEDVTVNSMVDIKKEFFTLIINNISFIIRNLFFTEQIKKSANTDGLTGVYNKKFMYEHLNSQIEKCIDDKASFCLAIFDIDYFKKFNDTYGHQHGDTVLKKVTEFAKTKLLENDTIYRYGGEEFVIYLPATTMRMAYTRMDEFRDELSGLDIRIQDTNELTPVNISIGIAKYPDDAIVLDELIKKADSALYKSKNNGRNQVTVYFDNEVGKKDIIENDGE